MKTLLLLALLLFSSTAFSCDDDNNKAELKKLQEQIDYNNTLQIMNYYQQRKAPPQVIYHPRDIDNSCPFPPCLPFRGGYKRWQ